MPNEMTKVSFCPQAGRCSSLKGFLVFNGLGGGSSGFTSLLMEHLAADYHSTPKVHFSILPTSNDSRVLVSYDCILAAHATMELSDLVFLFDNEALNKLCKRNMKLPHVDDLNRLISRIVSSITGSLRFGGFPTVSLTDLVTNLVPSPRFHFSMASYAPDVNPQVARSFPFSVDQITRSCFEPGNQMLNVNPFNGRYLSCCLLYGGNVMLKDVDATIATIKAQRTAQIGSWSPVLNVRKLILVRITVFGNIIF